MESVFKCGNCGKVLSATALMENGGCRIVFHIQGHKCFDGDREHYGPGPENPFCKNCKESNCEVSHDGTCSMVRLYLNKNSEV